MAGSLNKVMLIGNLGRDPEIRVTQEGVKVVSLSVATSEQWRDRATEERREKTEWHRIVVFNPRLAEVCEKYLRKGQKIYVEGQLQTRQWVDQQNKTCRVQEIVIRYKGEIVMLDGRSETSMMESDGGNSDYQGSLEAALDDEIPF